MNREALIALGLTEEQADKVVEGFGQMVPKSRLDDKIQEANDLKGQVAERDTQLSELQTKAAGNDALQSEITKLQEANKTAVADYEAKLQQKDFDFALTEALRSAKAKNPKAVEALLNKEAIKIDGDKLTGLDDQLIALKETDDYLFIAEGLKGKTPPIGGNPQPKDLSQMTYSEMTKYLAEHPNAQI